MKIMDYSVLVLAAGKGKRMKSQLPKVLHQILGCPMLGYVLRAVSEISPKRIVVVIGSGAERVKGAFPSDKIDYVFQREQLGTGHAAMCAREALKNFNRTIVIVNGDFPLIRPETLKGFIETHRKSKATVSLLTTVLDNPHGYGRVIKGRSGNVMRVVEEKDATAKEKETKEINSGTYCVESGFLWKALREIGRNNKQREYYLPDIVGIATKSRKKVVGYLATDSQEVLGVNNRAELASVERIIKRRTNEDFMRSGVTIVDPESTFISPQVSIGADTAIYANTFIYGNATIGNGCRIGPSVWIEDSQIGDEVTIKFSSYITRAVIENKVTIGPFAHIRPGAQILAGAQIGNFVEIKKSKIGRGSKVLHLSYVGDGILGERVNIGAGTITCNYDGFHKYKTVIEDDAFIGSDTMLVAPVRVGKGATTGAGSTITRDVPPGTLAIGRAKQVVIEGWKRRPREKKGDE